MYKKIFIALFAAGIFMTGCKKDDAEKKGTFVSTSAIANLAPITANNVTTMSATGAGDVDVVGTKTITERGICWATSSKPTTTNSKVVATGSDTGHFSAPITGLTPGTTYYSRAYVINNGQTYYGNEVKFEASVTVELIKNGDFELPKDNVKHLSINDIPNWKTEETNSGYTGREYDYWRNSGCAFIWDWAKPIYQIVGKVPSTKSDYAIKFDANIAWDAWQGDYKPTIVVKFSAFNGNDPTTRVSIGSVKIVENLPYGPWPGHDWGPSKTASFSIPAGSAFAGQNLVIEFYVIPYDDGINYSDLWYDFDNISVIQTIK